MDCLITITLVAAVTTLIWYIKSPEDKYKLGLLSLFYWGTTIMVFIDHLAGSILKKDNFLKLEITQEGWVVGSAMVVVPFAMWVIALVFKDPKQIWRRR